MTRTIPHANKFLERATFIIKRHASHVSTNGPIVFPARAPAAPSSPPSQPPLPSSNKASSSGNQRTNTSSSIASSSLLPKPRLDYPALLADPTHTTTNALLRKSPLPHGELHLPHLARLRETQLILTTKLNNIRSKQREISQLIKSKLGDTEELVRQAKKLKTRIGDYETNLSATEAELLELSLVLPNWSHPAVPLGTEENAITLETFGPEARPADPRRDHLRIANYYRWLDNEASTIAAGSSWPYLKGTLALLEQALINYALSIAIKHGFEPVIPPDVIRSDLAWRCGFLPRDEGDNTPTQTYHISNGASSSSGTSPELCLAGTAELPLSALFANRIIPSSELPRKVVGVGHAFRAEAGARGADTRGLYRVHQFTKVELFAVTQSTDTSSETMMEEIRAVQREIAEGLGLSVKVLDMPTEELGAPAARKYDMEAWMPGRGKWGEITSTSNCTDYQSRRLHIRYRPAAPSPGSPPHSDSLPFAHTLNGTAAAIPRLLIALVENGVRLKSDSTGTSEAQSVESDLEVEGKHLVKISEDKAKRTGAAASVQEGEIEGLDLPRALERFWIGGNECGTGRNKGTIRWI